MRFWIIYDQSLIWIFLILWLGESLFFEIAVMVHLSLQSILLNNLAEKVYTYTYIKTERGVREEERTMTKMCQLTLDWLEAY